MNQDKVAEGDSSESTEPVRRPYVAPAVTDFFQPVVVLGTDGADGCAAPKPPKH
jgi:hypothetical protein